MILDTSFLIDMMEEKADAVKRFDILLEKGAPLNITALSVFELFTGVALSMRPSEELEKIKRILKERESWPLDDSSAERAGTLKGRLAAEGFVLGSVDAMIAGIALQHNEPVLTRNARHFSRVPGLRVETY